MSVKGFVFKTAKAQNKPASKFRNFIERSSNAVFPAGTSLCWWFLHIKKKKKKTDSVRLIGTILHPLMQRTRPDDKDDTHSGWTFVDPATTPFLTGPTGHGSYSSEGCTPDSVNNARFIRDLYEKCTTEKTAYSVPLLWDKKKNTIVSNDSADIVRMFNSAFADLVPSKLDLYPQELRSEIDEINEWIYNDVGHGVYKCGFAGTQELYDAAVEKVFAGLDRAEIILSEHRFLYVREIYQFSRMAKTVVMPHIAMHYYGSHTHLNPFGIVLAGPNVDFTRPHDRDRFTNAVVPTFE
ncbi:Glutathione S-transferase N-terminal domain [Phytophthora infestans]|uniref:Glutathione S-transferase N-terminal domain n=1 Tax=Phytophthora infestans TaxID=4787 RepID=A0A833T289_PHYIN|nr:Glutathione S-transferase N-terminal domain [Phytophthora infestans]